MKSFQVELNKFRSLQLYGFFLNLSIWINVFFWRHTFFPLKPASRDIICWPIGFDCHLWQDVFRTLNPYIGFLLILFPALSGGMFFLSRKLNLAWWLLLFAWLLKMFVYFEDFHHMGNYHLMQNWLIFAFLFVPARNVTTKILLVSFYFFAGLLKFNQEWVSGAALLSDPHLPLPILHFLLISVIVLEIIGVWGLLSAKRSVLFISLLCFFVFHVYSFWIVGYYYPLEMFCFLSIFALQIYYKELPENSFRPIFKLPLVSKALLIGFALIQLVPQFTAGDTALTAEGRLLSLNMLDATPQCEAYAYEHFRNFTQEVNLTEPSLAVRMRCDVIVYLDQIRQLCKNKTRGMIDLGFYLMSRRSTDQTLIPVVMQAHACDKVADYSVFGGNSWVEHHPNVSLLNHVFHLGEVTAAVTEANYYRQNLERTGESRVEFDSNWKVAPKFSWRRSNGNVGIHTASKSSPIADELGVYVGGDAGQFFAYDHQGQLRWSFSTTSERGIHSTAVVDANYVYIGSYSGHFYCLNKKTGQLLWVTKLAAAVGASPLVRGDFIYMAAETGNDGYVLKLDRQTGDVIWKSVSFGEQTHSSPAFDEATQSLIVGANNGKLYSINSQTGKTNWLRSLGDPIKSTPLLFEGHAYISSWSRNLTVVDLKTGAVTDSLFLGKDLMSSPTLMRKSRQIVVANFLGEVIGIKIEPLRIAWKNHAVKEEKLKGSGLTLYNKNKSEERVLIPCSFSQICLFNSEGHKIWSLETSGAVSGMVDIYKDFVYASEEKPGGLVQWKIQR